VKPRIVILTIAMAAAVVTCRARAEQSVGPAAQGCEEQTTAGGLTISRRPSNSRGRLARYRRLSRRFPLVRMVERLAIAHTTSINQSGQWTDNDPALEPGSSGSTQPFPLQRRVGTAKSLANLYHGPCM
jgi:hypothetical protein